MARGTVAHLTPKGQSKHFPPIEEGQLDGLAKEPKERFLLPFLTLKRHALMAAERAEFQELPAAPP